MSPKDSTPRPEQGQTALDELVWASSRLSEAVEALARASGLARGDAAQGPPDEPPPAVAARLGVELSGVHSDVAGLPSMLRRAPPFVLNLGYGAESPFLVVVRRDLWGALVVLGPDGRRGRVSVAEVSERLCGPLVAWTRPGSRRAAGRRPAPASSPSASPRPGSAGVCSCGRRPGRAPWRSPETPGSCRRS
ncbi:hypothetical protein L6R49_25430 [Myxococcota bacterium]|nr:hypothetical protein [Myxococcota bacterium]